MAFFFLNILSVNQAFAQGSGYVFFSIGAGYSDVIPHQIVRAGNDKLFAFTAQKQLSTTLYAYFTPQSGLPSNSSALSGRVSVTVPARIVSTESAYDGNEIIHVLLNTTNGNIYDYPFNVSSNTFSSPTIISSNNPYGAGQMGTSGVSAMVDKSQQLHVAYWSSGNHITHKVYSYFQSTNSLTQVGSNTQLDASGSANHPALAVSPQDNSVTVTWISESPRPASLRVRTRSASGSWSSEQTISNSPVWVSTSNGINIDQGPSIVISKDNVRHIVYIEDYNGSTYGKIHYVRGVNTSWTDTYINASSHDPALAINSSDSVFILGHGHPNNASCKSEDDICVIQKVSNGWSNPTLFAAHPSGTSFDSSVSTKWSVVGWNRPDTIEFLFFGTPYDSSTLYYGRFSTSNSPQPTPSPTVKPGDADNDGDVDGVDYTRWLNNYNTSKLGPQFGDFNNSGVVDGVDYTVWLNNYSS